MKMIYVASPYAGDIEKNTEFAKQACRDVMNEGHAFFAPHLLYLGILDDNKPQERQHGIDMGLAMLSRCDELWCYGDQISHSMMQEIAEAEKLGIPVRKGMEQANDWDALLNRASELRDGIERAFSAEIPLENPTQEEKQTYETTGRKMLESADLMLDHYSVWLATMDDNQFAHDMQQGNSFHPQEEASAPDKWDTLLNRASELRDGIERAFSKEIPLENPTQEEKQTYETTGRKMLESADLMLDHYSAWLATMDDRQLATAPDETVTMQM